MVLQRSLSVMYIGCTKKLIEYAKIAPIVLLGTEPFFSWSANLITINHRKAIVVINDAVRYGFVLYGITAKTIKNLDSLMLEGIRSCLDAECVSENIVNRFMPEPRYTPWRDTIDVQSAYT